MFPFFAMCCGEKVDRRKHQEHKLKFMKWMRDDMETRLAGLNSAIASIEAQLERDSSDAA
ncbi:MAG: hypothetical protein AB4040_08860 [Synechococcus sp.]